MKQKILEAIDGGLTRLGDIIYVCDISTASQVILCLDTLQKLRRAGELVYDRKGGWKRP